MEHEFLGALAGDDHLAARVRRDVAGGPAERETRVGRRRGHPATALKGSTEVSPSGRHPGLSEVGARAFLGASSSEEFLGMPKTWPHKASGIDRNLIARAGDRSYGSYGTYPAMPAHPLLSRKTAFQRALLGWYRRHARPLPWRETPSLYRTVVSEFMLQQTQVKTALPVLCALDGGAPGLLRPGRSAGVPRILKLWEGWAITRGRGICTGSPGPYRFSPNTRARRSPGANCPGSARTPRRRSPASRSAPRAPPASTATSSASSHA